MRVKSTIIRENAYSHDEGSRIRNGVARMKPVKSNLSNKLKPNDETRAGIRVKTL